MRTRVLAGAILAALLGTTARAEDKPLERLDLDRRIVKVVYESALLGTDIYNRGRREECFRLYQGTLAAVLPLLDHRPKLAASVKQRMDKALTLDAAEGAHELRAALDEIQNEIAPNPLAKSLPKEPKPEPKPEPKLTTLWDRLGGEKGVQKVVDDLIALAIEDPKVNFLRGGTVKLDKKGVDSLKQKLVEMISETTGGPLKYTGKDMKTAHAGMKITSDEFDALATILAEVLKKNKVADADAAALLKIVGSTKPLMVEGKGM